MIYPNGSSSLVSSFCGSCFWWYKILCLVIFLCFAFFKSDAPKWVALVPTLTHPDHRISYFWIRGSIVNSEYCLSCSSVLFIHSKRMPRKEHFSFVLVFLFVQMIFLKSVFPAVQGICPGASLFRPWHYVQKINWQCSKNHISLSRSARLFLFHKEWLTLQSVRGIHFSLLVVERAWSYWMPLLFNISQMFISDVSLDFGRQ